LLRSFPFRSEGLGHFPTSHFQPTRRSAGGRKYGSGYPLPMLATNVFIPYALIPYYGEKAILPNFRKRKTLQFKKDCNAF